MKKSEFAKRVKVHPSRVSSYVRLGLPVRDGKIPLGEGLAWVKSNVSRLLSGNHRSHGTKRRAGENKFLASRARFQQAKAEAAEYELARARGAFLPTREVVEYQETRAAAERDALLGLPSRVSGEMAARLGVDERKLHAEFDRIIRLHLAERSGALENAR